MKREKSCGALIIDQSQGKHNILLIQHKTGNWSYPKGHMEQGETEQATAIREVMEETNINVELLPGFREAIAYSPKKGVMKTVVYFLAKPKNYDCRPQLSELKATGWFDFEQAESMITYPNDKEIFTKMKDFLQKHSI